ncbi:WD repeat-containing protein 59 [Schistosoma japonicum]|nr:WD repeat-containing protein 59 [Schistosoma japonicum]
MKTDPNTNLLELKGFQISQIAADPIGRCVALCGINELVISPLKHPSQYSAFSLPSKLGCSGLAWHPNDHTKLAIARSNKCELLLWDANECRLSTNTSLGGYVRVINSLDWSPVHPFLLATTSADQFRAICVWDLRDMSRPVRAIESLSSPVIVKWNRFLSGKFATCHSSGVRTWDLRISVPEQYISVQTDHIRDFDWSPQNVNQLVTISEYSEMRLWDIENPSYPLKKVRLHEIKLKKVIYTPSGDHIIILPEQCHWPVHGISVWSTINLTQSHDLLQVAKSHSSNNDITTNKTSTIENSISNNNESGNNNDNSGNNGNISDQRICSPGCTDSYILDMSWLIYPSSNLSSASTTTDEHELASDLQLDNETSAANHNLDYCLKKNVHLLTWSVDQTLRAYPIHFKSASLHDSEPIVNQSNKQTRIIKEKSNELTNDKLSTNVNPKINQSKKIGYVPSSSLNKPKVTDSQPRGEEYGQRTSVSKPCLSVSKSGMNTDSKSSNQEDSAFQFLAQELSLLSHRAGQYKLEEMDLINRTAKLILFYCRRNHHHHYSLCSVTNTCGRPRPNAVMNNEGLDSLLLPSTTDLISQMEFSEHPNSWKVHRRNSLSIDTDQTSLNRVNISNSTAICDNKVNVPLTKHPSSHSFNVLIDSSHEIDKFTAIDNRMPLAGSIILSIEFPDNYPLNGALPEFHVLDCSPPLPPEVLDELKSVLYSTASELVCASRGCVEPCIRNAVITLQTYPTLNKQAGNDITNLKLPSLSNRNYDGFGVKINKFTKPTNTDTIAPIKRKCKLSMGIPFPKTSGAHFTTSGLIVTFGLPESLSYIRKSFKSTSIDDKCQIDLKNNASPTTTNNDNDYTKDWTPQSFNGYQTFIHQFSSTNREYNNDMRKSFQYCIGNIIDSFARLEADCNEHKRQCLNPNHTTELIGSPFESNLESRQNSVDSTTNNNSDGSNNTEIKDSYESNGVSEPKWIDSMSTLCLKYVDSKNSYEMFASHFNMIYPSTVQIYDLSPLIWDRYLMYNYSLNTDNLQRMCIHNLHVVYNVHRKDLIRFWQYAVVLSISLSHTENSHQVYQPLASQLIGRPLFDIWIRHFLRIHDVQSLAMLALVLQKLNQINEFKFDTLDDSNISLDKLDNTITSLLSANNFLETFSLCQMNDSEKTTNLLGCNAVANSSLEQQVSFTLDNSDETQSEFSLVFGQSNENMNSCLTEQLLTKELPINSICAYQSRLVPCTFYTYFLNISILLSLFNLSNFSKNIDV